MTTFHGFLGEAWVSASAGEESVWKEVGFYKKDFVSRVESIVFRKLQRCEDSHKNFRNNTLSKPQVIPSPWRFCFMQRSCCRDCRMPYFSRLLPACAHLLRERFYQKTQTCSCCGAEIKMSDSMCEEGKIEQFWIKI